MAEKVTDVSRNKLIIATVVASLYFILSLKPAYACVCGGCPSVEGSLKNADAVFVGKVQRVENSSRFWNIWRPERKIVTLKVLYAWKGVSKETTTVTTGVGSGDCGYYFEVGDVVLTYIYADDEYGEFSTNICTRTRSITYAKKDLEILGQPRFRNESIGN